MMLMHLQSCMSLKLSTLFISRHRWEIGSYGYHGDDGHKFGGSGKGEVRCRTMHFIRHMPHSAHMHAIVTYALPPFLPTLRCFPLSGVRAEVWERRHCRRLLPPRTPGDILHVSLRQQTSLMLPTTTPLFCTFIVSHP